MTTPDPNVAAVITVNDMYHELQGVRSDVQTLVGKFDAIPAQITALQEGARLTAPLPALVADHETSIRTLHTSVTVLKTQAKALWVGLGAVVLGLGTVAAWLQAIHG